MIPVPTDLKVVTVPALEPWKPTVSTSEAAAWRDLVAKAQALPQGEAVLLGSLGLRHEKGTRRLQMITSVMQAHGRTERTLAAVAELVRVRMWVQDGNIYLGPLETN